MSRALVGRTISLLVVQSLGGCSNASDVPLFARPVTSAPVPAPVRHSCDAPWPVLAAGVETGRVCAEDLGPGALTVVDLSDDWVPRVLRSEGDAGAPVPQYRETYVALADERPEASSRHQRFLEPYGIFPSLRVAGARLLDQARHDCHARIDSAPIAALTRRLEPFSALRPSAAEKAALVALDARLVCEGLLAPTTRPRPRWRLQNALEAYQRQHMIVSRGFLDAETRRVLMEDSRELDFRTLLRALRARVVDATGLIEDGSAAGARGLVLGRRIDGDAFVVERGAPLAEGAPDLISPATEAAARALGWTDPDAAAAFFRAHGPDGTHALAVALRLPPAPAYHGEHMELRAEIDRGDVWYSMPARRGRIEHRPTLTLYAATASGDEVALVRWPTTIGGWKKERSRWGEIGLKFKDSDVGKRVWRDIVAAPAWLPPATTPPRTLVRRDDDGRWVADTDLVGPGYASAYGLVMLIHHDPVRRRGVVRWEDNGIRTHGSVSYQSILGGESHGCHRLFNSDAVQLASFLLRHRHHVAHGTDERPFTRVVSWLGRRVDVTIPNRGYTFELTPPVVVEVLKGNVRGKLSTRFVRAYRPRPTRVATSTDAPAEGVAPDASAPAADPTAAPGAAPPEPDPPVLPGPAPVEP
jgi:hypothetical protein